MAPVILTAVGDISLGDSPKCLGFGLKRKILSKSPYFPFEKIKKCLSGDFVFGNLETVLSETGLIKYDFKSEQLRGHPLFVDGLRGAGFNILNIANNHAMQHGYLPFSETIQCLRDNDILVVGQKQRDAQFVSKPTIVERNDMVFGFLGYSFEDDCYAKKDDIAYANISDKNSIIRDIKLLRKQVDWIILSLHWGVEFMNEPSPVMISLARDFVDAGANVILGHHPHVVQPIERYKNAIICFSLGNFIFDMMWNQDYCCGMIVKIKFERGCHIKCKIHPTLINSEFQVEPLTGKKRLDFFLRLNGYKGNCKKNIKLDIEKSNIKYYSQYLDRLKKDMLRSNLYFIKTLFTKTPPRFLPCKIGYFFSKFIR